jgi:hypothetical protein
VFREAIHNPSIKARHISNELVEIYNRGCGGVELRAVGREFKDAARRIERVAAGPR